MKWYRVLQTKKKSIKRREIWDHLSILCIILRMASRDVIINIRWLHSAWLQPTHLGQHLRGKSPNQSLIYTIHRCIWVCNGRQHFCGFPVALEIQLGLNDIYFPSSCLCSCGIRHCTGVMCLVLPQNLTKPDKCNFITQVRTFLHYHYNLKWPQSDLKPAVFPEDLKSTTITWY